MLDILYNTNEVEENYQIYNDRIPKSLIAIGETPGGNLICMGIDKTSKSYGKLYFWNHEEELLYNNLYLISEDFYVFIESLECLKEELSNNKDLVSFWLSDELLND